MSETPKMQRYDVTARGGVYVDLDPTGEWVRWEDLSRYFTQEEVDHLRSRAEYERKELEERKRNPPRLAFTDYFDQSEYQIAALESVVAKIAAFLPPTKAEPPSQ